MMILITEQQPGARYGVAEPPSLSHISSPSQGFSRSLHCCPDLIRSDLLLLRSSLPSPSSIHLSHTLHPFQLLSNFLDWVLIFSPFPLSCSPVAAHLFALVPSLLHCHQLLYTEQRVITFVLHRVSLIGFMPPSSATSAEKKRLKPFVIFKP